MKGTNIDFDYLWILLFLCLALAASDDCGNQRANIRELYCPTEASK